jgi:hypothetical protein
MLKKMLKHVKTNSMKGACNMAECTNLLHHKPITLFQLTLLGPRHLWGAVVLLTCPLVLPGATSARFWIHSSDRTAIRIKLGHIPNVQGKSYCVYLYICISLYPFVSRRPVLLWTLCRQCSIDRRQRVLGLFRLVVLALGHVHNMTEDGDTIEINLMV